MKLLLSLSLLFLVCVPAFAQAAPETATVHIYRAKRS